MNKLNADRSLIKGMGEVLEHLEGKRTLTRYAVPIPNVDIKLIREQQNLSQRKFAETYHIPLGTLQGWEQGRREPEHMARLFLNMIDANPKKIRKLLEETFQPAT